MLGSQVIREYSQFIEQHQEPSTPGWNRMIIWGAVALIRAHSQQGLLPFPHHGRCSCAMLPAARSAPEKRTWRLACYVRLRPWNQHQNDSRHNDQSFAWPSYQPHLVGGVYEAFEEDEELHSTPPPSPLRLPCSSTFAHIRVPPHRTHHIHANAGCCTFSRTLTFRVGLMRRLRKIEKAEGDSKVWSCPLM